MFSLDLLPCRHEAVYPADQQVCYQEHQQDDEADEYDRADQSRSIGEVRDLEC